MTHPKVQVYSFHRCPFAMRVRFALYEKGITFEVIEEDLKNFSPALRSLHPEARVPVLVHGDTVVYESSIILEYIEEAFPNTPMLMPTEAVSRAQVRLWGYWCNQIFKPDLDRFKYGTSRFPSVDCEGVEGRLTRHVSKLEEKLAKKPWLVGADFSIADILVFPFVRQLSRVTPAPEFLANFPLTQLWRDTIDIRPAFRRTISKDS